MPWGEIKDQLTYMGIDTYTKKWERIKTYGGKLCENVTQAVARDLLSESLLRLENRNHPVVMHVHDECVVEVPSNFSSDKEVEKICEELPTWAGGLPMKSEAWEGERYQK